MSCACASRAYPLTRLMLSKSGRRSDGRQPALRPVAMLCDRRIGQAVAASLTLLAVGAALAPTARADDQLTTKLTKRSGTSITLRTVLPCSSVRMRSSSRARAERLLLGQAFRNAQPVPQLSVHLHDHLDAVLRGKRLICRWPTSVKHRSWLPKPLPQFFSKMWREWAQQPCQALQHLLHDSSRELRFAVVKLVGQLHDRGDRRVEVPAGVEVMP